MLRSPRDEFLVRQLGVELLDLGPDFVDLALQALRLGVDVDDAGKGQRVAAGLRMGTVWINDYHPYVAQAEWGGYKQSGIGRETHKMMLDHYQQTKNLLVSYSPKALGFF